MRYKKNILILIVLIILSVGIWYLFSAKNRNDIGGVRENGSTINSKSSKITADKKFRKARLKVSLLNLESKEDLHYKVTDPNNVIVLEGVVKGGEEFKSKEIVTKWVEGDWTIEFKKNDEIMYDYTYELKFTNK
ncbi:hypothetical protein SAMN05444401_0116 [Clostridium amylolyticum]|uniref:Uncharacterized protein n=1 Tax=Clostridium amylolyticum TaxID=1121298 RepID=A0A1M6N6V6_9CLOT|nr:hypothetical protein [Clostridium amylolyticum]SHJ91382.1 hypothetical protein SAMN05444401_0116 [Clostridium amylolyticum]